MLRSYIQGRERLWHSRDENRFARPFEWGLEHVGLTNGLDPLLAMEQFASESVANSDDFYAYGPSANYDFDGHTLKFPSSIDTPYDSNNTVWGRYFPGTSGLAVVVLPQWNAQWESHIALCRILQRFGIGSLRLSLPYHDHRRPAHLERSEYLVGPNLGLTLASTRQAVLDTRRAGDWLLEQGYGRLGILGTSIGSCVGFLAMAHDPRFECAAFIHVSSYFADVVWEGLSTSHVRNSLEPSIALEELRRVWAPISPFPFIPRLGSSSQEMLVLWGKYDLSFPSHLSEMSFGEFDRHGVNYDLVTLPCGHYTMGNFPFSAIAGFRTVKYLRRFRD